MDFTAIDFETANRRRDSACQLAAVRVRANKIVATAMWMIRPEPFYFSPMNIQIHGITPARVEKEPCFGDLWPEIHQFLQDELPAEVPEGHSLDCIVAHNASFDMGVLLGSMQSHRVATPPMHFTCTRVVAKQTWPERPRYGLKPLAEWLGIQFKHHDALEDAVACAKIMIAAGIHRRAGSLVSLEANLRLSRGIAGASGSQGPKSTRRSRAPRRTYSYTSTRTISEMGTVMQSTATYQTMTGDPNASFQNASESLDVQRLMIRAQFIRSLSGQDVVFTGVLRRLSRVDAEALATSLGGNLRESVNQKTSLLVVGAPDERTQKSGRQWSVKQEAAERLRSEGHPVRIVDEDEFLAMVISPTSDNQHAHG